MSSKPSHEQLVEVARVAFQNSYSPYSHYRVGAALLTKDGKVFPGCNIELASFAGGMCAERVAIAKAVSEGHKEFEAIAVVCEQSPEAYPCGICRQSLAEFGVDFDVVVPTKTGTTKSLKLRELLPHYFGPGHVQGTI